MPIVSPLDNDYYAWTMGQIVWERFHDYVVRYGFKNRTLSIRLTDYLKVDALREDLDAIRFLRYTDKEIQVLRNQGIFSEGYLDFLKRMRLPEIEVEDRNGWLNIEYCGDWASAIFIESPLLATVEEHYVKGLIKKNGGSYGHLTSEGHRRLNVKIDVWKEHPSIRIADMATRRRFPGLVNNHDWHLYVLSRLRAEMPDQLVGTSNPYLANLFGLPMIGTMAHQMFMVLAAKKLSAADCVNPLRDAQNLIYDLWEEKYGEVDDGRMLIALPDTFGTAFTLSHFGAERARRWRGFRQDSGDPFVQLGKIIKFYIANEIAPEEKLVIPSDSLDVNKTISLDTHLGKLPHIFGIGGNIGNDLGIDTPAIVAKPIDVDGLRCVKLGDDLSKSGGDQDTVNRYKELSKWGRI